MPDPSKPKRGGWFAAQLQTHLPGEAADATLVQKGHAAKPGSTVRALRNLAGGAVESLGEIPLTITPRGVVHMPDFVKQGLHHAADAIAGGAAKDVSDESFRQIGSLAPFVLPYHGLNRAAEAVATRAGANETGLLIKALRSEGGATLDRAGNAFKGSGYAVADPALTARVSSEAEMRAFLARPDVQKALAAGKQIGKWTDPATGITEINITDVLPTHRAAQALGRQRGELALGELKNGEYQGDVPVAHPEGVPNESVRAAAKSYTQGAGMEAPRSFRPVEHDRALSQDIADWYETAKNDPSDPKVKASYEAFNRETHAQYEHLKAQGWTFEPATDPAHDTYKSAEDMRRAVAHKSLKVFSGGEPNALTSPQQNFEFRAVHDVMAHAGEGYEFHPNGEYNAALKHSQMYSPEAQKALFTETVGQNANLNYGPNGEFNRANMGSEIFPEQKATLLPDHFVGRLLAHRDQAIGPVAEGETMVGRDATGATVTNRGRAIRPAGVFTEDLPEYKAPRVYTPRTTGAPVAAAPDAGLIPGASVAGPRQALPSRATDIRSESAIAAHDPQVPVGFRLEQRDGEYIFRREGMPYVYGRGKTPAKAYASAVLGGHIGQADPLGRLLRRVDPNSMAPDAGLVPGRAPVGPRAGRTLPSMAESARTESWTEAHNDIPSLKAKGLSVQRTPEGTAAIRDRAGRTFATGRTPADAMANLTLRRNGLAPNPAAPAVQAPEKIVGAAYSTLKDPTTGEYFSGANHAAVRAAAKAAGLKEGFLESNSGFVTNRGRFVGRMEAAKIGTEQGQVKAVGPRNLSETFKPGELGTPEQRAAYRARLKQGLAIPGPYTPGAGGETAPERIVSASIRHKGREWDGGQHFEAFDNAAEDGLSEDDLFEAEQGFRTSTGRFVDRKEAARIAEAARQVSRAPEDVGAELLAHELDGPTPDLPPMLPPRAVPPPIPGPWQPTSRGVFPRDVAPIQGTAPLDPRLVARMPRGEPSELAQAIADSKVVERGLQKDVERGLPLGGDPWYEGAPIKATFESGDPFSFHDFNLARGSGSIQAPTHLEIPTATGLLFGRRNGLSTMAEIKAAHQAMYPGEPSLWGTEATATNYLRAVANDAQLPATAGTGERKVAWYTQGNEGGAPGADVAIDKHEGRRQLQLAWTDRRIRPLLKTLGYTEETATGPRADVVPVRNALDYTLLSSPYRRIADRMGLASPQQAQAGRWIGGVPLTGLKSQPTGDFTQTLEDVLMHTANVRGLPTDPAGLTSLWRRLRRGEDIAAPIYGNDPLKYLYNGQGSFGF